MATDKQSAGLTERRIRDAKPSVKTRMLWDRQVNGLGVRITPSGVKSYILNYRFNGQQRRATLGRTSEMSLRAARELAGEELAKIRKGGPGPLQRRREAREAPTVNHGLDRFFNEYAPQRIARGRMRERTRYDYTKQADRTIRPKLGKLKIADVTRQDVERAVAERAPVQRNRTLALLSRLFNQFETWGYRPQYTNPCRGIERAKEEPRDRVMKPSEVRAIDEVLGQVDDPFAVAAIRFLFLTGWRVGEARALKWEHVESETREIVLPDSKTGRQTRDVAALALELLGDVPRINGNPYVFAGLRSAAIGYKRLRDCFAHVCQEAGVEDCRLHDIRRTLATSAAASGLGVFLLRDFLGHKTVEMANRYARRAGQELQQANDASAERMAALLAGTHGEAAPIVRVNGPEGDVAIERPVAPAETIANCRELLARGEAPSLALVEDLLEIAKADVDRPVQGR